jgi:hypothetical protein
VGDGHIALASAKSPTQSNEYDREAMNHASILIVDLAVFA